MVITLFNENVYVNVTWMSSLNCTCLITLFNENVCVSSLNCLWLITLFNANVYANVTWLSCVNCYMVDDIVERKCLRKCYMTKFVILNRNMADSVVKKNIDVKP
jgi:hypothetical protein